MSLSLGVSNGSDPLVFHESNPGGNPDINPPSLPVEIVQPFREPMPQSCVHGIPQSTLSNLIDLSKALREVLYVLDSFPFSLSPFYGEIITERQDMSIFILNYLFFLLSWKGMKISLHFNLAEFSCKDGTPYPTQWLSDRLIPLVSDLEILRAYLNDPILINSAYRTPAYNRKIGGALLSQHTQGRAVDIKCINVKVKDLHQAILDLIKQGKIKNGGVGLYKTWVHIDQGPRRRWKG